MAISPMLERETDFISLLIVIIIEGEGVREGERERGREGEREREGGRERGV